MTHLDAYDRILDGTRRDPYRVAVALPEPVEIEDALVAAGYRFATAGDGLAVENDALSAGSCRVTTDEGGFVRPDGRDLGLSDVQALVEARQTIRIEVELGPNWRADVRALAVMVEQVAPRFVGLSDVEAITYWSPRWVRAVAAGRPVPLSDIFEIHGVVDDGRLWAHTHGLRRLGLIELELRGDIDDVSFGFAGRVINAAAEAMHAAGVPPPGAAFRVSHELAIEWTPWQDAGWDDDELGGPADRDDDHSGPSGVLTPSRGDPSLTTSLTFDDEGWVVPVDGLGLFEEQARATAAAAFQASREPGRSMRLSSAQAEGTVEASDGRTFTVVTDDGVQVDVPAAAVESWWVSCTADYSLGPWKAHNVTVIEDVAAARRATYDDEGRPLCSVCGTALGSGHRCAEP